MKKYLKLPYFPILLAPFLLFSPLIISGKALYWGTPSLQFVPWWDWAWASVWGGDLPLWNPLVGMGAPLIANYQSALFYPMNWVNFVLHWIGGAPFMAWGQAIYVASHLAIAGLGMVYVVRLLGCDDISQTVSGLAFSLSGYMVARAGFLSITAASAWLPWMMAFSLLFIREKGFAPVFKLIIVITLQLLAGHAQTAYYSLLLMGLWCIYWSWLERSERDWISKMKQTAINAGNILIACVVASLIAAVQLWPTAEYLAQSQRATAVDYEFAMTYSYWPWRFLTLVAPDIFGNPRLGNYWGYGNYWEDALYIGLLPLLMALGLVIKSAGKMIRSKGQAQEKHAYWNSSFPIFLFGIVIVSFVLAMGKNTPIFPWMYRHIPTFDLFQAPTRINIWAVFALSVLAGIGVGQWRRPEDKGLYWTRLATAGAVAVAIGAGATWFLIDSIKPTFIRATALAGLWGLGAGALSLLVPQKKRDQRRFAWWKWGVTVWVTVDLLVAGWGLNPGVTLDFYREKDTKGGKKERLYLPPQEEYEIKYQHFFSFESYRPAHDWQALRASSLPNLNMLDVLASVNNFDPLVPGRYQEWMDALETIGPDRRNAVMDLMGVGSIGGQIGDGSIIYENVPGEKLPYRWLSCARVVSDPEDALESVMFGDVDLSQWVLLEDRSALSGEACQASERDIEMVEQSPNRWVFRVYQGRGGWLLRASVWYPGWNAFMDGRKVTLYRADYVFQTVYVPEGEHIVVFSYQPMSAIMGAALSLSAMLGCFVVFNLKNRSKGD
ncbi:MAG: YfhO family protein [Anaerolineales bacterium]